MPFVTYALRSQEGVQPPFVERTKECQFSENAQGNEMVIARVILGFVLPERTRENDHEGNVMVSSSIQQE